MYYFSLLARPLGDNFESIARLWVANKMLSAVNNVRAALMWSIWTFCDSMIFNNQLWLSAKQIWWLILRSLSSGVGTAWTLSARGVSDLGAPLTLIWIEKLQRADCSYILHTDSATKSDNEGLGIARKPVRWNACDIPRHLVSCKIELNCIFYKRNNGIYLY